MDAWITIIAIAVVLWWINNNKTSSTSKTKIRETSEYKTPTGKIYVERTVEYDDRDMSIKDRPYTPRQPQNYSPLQQPVTIERDEKRTINSRDETIGKIRDETKQLKERVSKILPDSHSSSSSITELTHKQCPNCRRDLPLGSFRASSKHSDGYTKWCAECLSHSSRNDIPAHLKLCPKCNQRRMKSSFAKNSNTHDGLAKWCKYCMAGVKR